MASITVQQLLVRLEEQQAEIDDLKAQVGRGGVCSDPSHPITVRVSSCHDAGRSRRPRLEPLASSAPSYSILTCLLTPRAAGAGIIRQQFVNAHPQSDQYRSRQRNLGHVQLECHHSRKSTSADASAVAVRGTVDNKQSTGGIGVNGLAPAGVGVSGSSTSGTGVAGSSSTGAGVTGTSASTAGGAVAVEGTITSTSPGGSAAGVFGQNNGTETA